MPTPHADGQATVAAVLFGTAEEGRRILHDELLAEDELAGKVRSAATTVVPKGALALIRRQVADAAISRCCRSRSRMFSPAPGRDIPS